MWHKRKKKWKYLTGKYYNAPLLIKTSFVKHYKSLLLPRFWWHDDDRVSFFFWQRCLFSLSLINTSYTVYVWSTTIDEQIDQSESKKDLRLTDWL